MKHDSEQTSKPQKRSPALIAARLAFLQHGRPAFSIRQREVINRDDLDERLLAAITAYIKD